MALGARRGRCGALIIRRAAIQVGLGLVFGILCTMAWDAAFFNDRSARDPSVLRFASPAESSRQLPHCLPSFLLRVHSGFSIDHTR